MTIDAKIEAVLFAVGKAVHLRQLAEWCEVREEEILLALDALAQRLQTSGLQLVRHGKDVELVTRKEAALFVRRVVKDEQQGELSRPSLEALAILAYRGPLTRPELEQIRGVQSALILRHLMVRGLVEMREEKRLGQPVYAVTVDFLKHIGLDRIESLPRFEEWHAEGMVDRALEKLG